MSEELTQTKAIQIENVNNKVNIVIDMSSFDLFELCHCRYNYRHNMNRSVPAVEKSKSLDLGSLAHEGLEFYYKGLQSELKFEDRMQAAITRIQFVSSDPALSNADPDEISTIINAITQACDYWRFEDEQLRIIEVEQPFAYLLYEDDFIRIIITGKIDLLVDKPALGRNQGYSNLPMDHKTYSRDSELLRLSNQFMNYCCATGSYYLVVNRIGLQKTLKPEEKFKRLPLAYDPIILTEWKQNLTNVILDEYLTCVKTGHWNMNFTSCLKFNRKCEYYEICDSSGEEAKRFKLENRYDIVSPWDVTSSFKKGTR